MLFMIVYAFEPAQTNEVVKRRLERGEAAPEGMKVIGEWIQPGALRGFMLLEANDLKTIMAMTVPWGDLMKFEIVPALEVEEVLKMAKSLK